jgi:hypothetical protein
VLGKRCHPRLNLLGCGEYHGHRLWMHRSHNIIRLSREEAEQKMLAFHWISFRAPHASP